MACALSGGPDSVALVALAVAAGCRVTAHHVHHGLRASADHDALIAERAAARLQVGFERHDVDVAAGPNLEARARAARYGALPSGVLTGHTADDQAETLILRLLRGAGADGLAAMDPGPTHPILGLRRWETAAHCRALGLETALDPSNVDPAHQRNRIRHELMPALADIARRDVVPLLCRTADLLREDEAYLERLAAELDPTDARALAAAEPALARRAVRNWLGHEGYPPDAATVERVLEVARGRRIACEIHGGRRVARSAWRLRLELPDP